MNLFSYSILTAFFLIPYVHFNIKNYFKPSDRYTLVDSSKILKIIENTAKKHELKFQKN